MSIGPANFTPMEQDVVVSRVCLVMSTLTELGLVAPEGGGLPDREDRTYSGLRSFAAKTLARVSEVTSSPLRLTPRLLPPSLWLPPGAGTPAYIDLGTYDCMDARIVFGDRAPSCVIVPLLVCARGDQRDTSALTSRHTFAGLHAAEGAADAADDTGGGAQPGGPPHAREHPRGSPHTAGDASSAGTECHGWVCSSHGLPSTPPAMSFAPHVALLQTRFWFTLSR